MTQVVIFNDIDPSEMAFRRSLGPYRIAQSLKDAGFTVQVVEWYSSWAIPDLKRLLDHLIGPDTLWVGWSSTFMVSKNQASSIRQQMWSRPLADVDWTFDYIKANSSAWLVYGGAYAHMFAFDPRIDTFVTGYADNSIVPYTQDVYAGKLPPKFLNSRDYPEPDICKINTDWTDPSYCILPNEAIPVEFGRGCIFKCKFCSYPLIGKRKGTYQRPVEQVVKQMLDAWHATGCDRFYFTDDTFNDDQERLQELHTAFKELPFKPKFSCFLRLDLIERWPDTADLLLDMGLVGCFFGVETFNKKSAVCVGKGLDPKRTKAELHRLRRLWGNQVLVSVGLILGLPYDTEEYFKELEEWITAPDCPTHNVSINTLWIGMKRPPEGASQKDGWSEFNLNREIYGYEVDGPNWSLPSQNIDKALCDQWRTHFYKLTYDRNHISEFYVQDYANLGVTIEDMRALPAEEIIKKYPLERLLRQRKRQYQNRLLAWLDTRAPNTNPATVNNSHGLALL